MKKLLSPICAALVASIVSGCVAVSNTEPAGTEPVKLEASEWEGVWAAGDGIHGILLVAVKDAEKGILGVGSVDDKDGSFTVKNFDVAVRAAPKDGGGRVFVNVVYKDVSDKDEKDGIAEKTANSHIWFVLVKEKGSASLLIPDHEAFLKLIAEGKLKGAKDGDCVVTELSSEELTKLITDSEDGDLFHWDSPTPLIRLKDGR